MEDKQLSNQESLDLITKMIDNTRRNFNNNGGAMFLIWGYTTIAVTMAIYILFSITGNHNFMWLWWALPVIGGLLTWRHYKHYPKPVTTQLDKITSRIWTTFSISTFLCVISNYAVTLISDTTYFYILFVIALLLSNATVITGMMIKFRPVVIGGFAGMILSFLLPAYSQSIIQFPIFAAIFLIAQVIPGHILNRECKKTYGKNDGKKVD